MLLAVDCGHHIVFALYEGDNNRQIRISTDPKAAPMNIWSG